MAHFPTVVIAADLPFPTAPHSLQGVVEAQQVFRLIAVAHSRQLVAELLGGGDLRGQPDDFLKGLFPELGEVVLVVLVQPQLQDCVLVLTHRS